MTKRRGSGNYKVGYCRPPKEHQFQPGTSGHKGGRPRKGSPGPFADIVREDLATTIVVTENGRQRRITKREAIATTLVNMALTGTPSERLRASKLLLDMGYFEPSPAELRLDRDAARKFIERLAEEARRTEEWQQDFDERHHRRFSSD